MSTTQRNKVIYMRPTGIDSDGIVDLYMQKPDDKLGAFAKRLPRVSLEANPAYQQGRIIAAAVQATIEEDPRLKAIGIYSEFAGRLVSVIKHSPFDIPVGQWRFITNAFVGANYHTETDVFGPNHATWEPKIMDFGTGTNEVGMIKGKEFPNEMNLGVWGEDDEYWRRIKTYYDYDDHVVIAKMFGKDQAFTTGSSLLDKVNNARMQNSLMPLNADPGMTAYAQKHADFMARNSYTGTQSNGNIPPHIDAINSGFVEEFSEYGRSIYVYRGISVSGPGADINLEDVYQEAVDTWLKGDSNILHKDYNVCGFGVVKQLVQSSSQYDIYICVDFATMQTVGTRTDAIDLTESQGTEEYDKAAAGIGVSINYAIEYHQRPIYYINSYNPLSTIHNATDWAPIPSTRYVLIGFFNDITLLDEDIVADRGYVNWPLQKQIDFQEVTGNIQTEIDPTYYPIVLANSDFEPDNLRSGQITAARQDLDTLQWRYTVVTNKGDVFQKVRGFSNTEFPVGRWVVIHGAEKITDSLGNEIVISDGWYIIPTSSTYYENVVENGPGIS